MPVQLKKAERKLIRQLNDDNYCLDYYVGIILADLEIGSLQIQ